MKQLETTQKVIGENKFFIVPFPAFTAAGISGDLAAVISPMLGGIATLLGQGDDNIMDMDAEKAAPILSSAFSTLSGNKVEELIEKLLVKHGNISVEGPATEGSTMRLDKDLANEVFCGEVQDMYVLCFEVIKLNFNGFFKKLGNQSGSLQGIIQKAKPSKTNTES